MKRTIIYSLLLLITYSLQAQEKKDVKVLSRQEVSERLLPKFAPLAFLPATLVNNQHIKESREKEKQLKIPELSNADSVDIVYENIPGLNPGDPAIPVRIYKPKGLTKSPIFLWFHGGGFIYGNLNWDHKMCANMAIRAKVVVISVDYRLAPENPYPAGVNDAYAVFQWSIKNANQIDGDPERLGIGGGSAGAGIAGSMALMNREKKGPEIKLQALIFPPGDIDTTRVSIQELWDIPGVKGADVPILLRYYLGENFNNPPKNVLPGMTDNFKDLPATYLVTCGVDPLRDGGLQLGINLIEAGIPVELHNFPGYPHGMLPDRVYPELYEFLNTYYAIDHKTSKVTQTKE
jgi:acetyl esterase